jgi:hypothetical protein
MYEWHYYMGLIRSKSSFFHLSNVTDNRWFVHFPSFNLILVLKLHTFYYFQVKKLGSAICLLKLPAVVCKSKIKAISMAM